MFDDFGFDETRLRTQDERLAAWADQAASRPPEQTVIVEVGAGTVLPTIRQKAVALSASEGWPLIRVNPQEPDAPANGVVLKAGAARALGLIDTTVGS